MKFFRSLFAAALVAVSMCAAILPTTAQAQAFSGGCATIRGSFTATVTGVTATTTGTIQYRVTTACQVTLWATAGIAGTSNAATMTITGLPYNLAPNAAMVAAQIMPTIVLDNGANVVGCVSISAPASPPALLTFSNSGACVGAMTNTGSKGLQSGWTITYTLY